MKTLWYSHRWALQVSFRQLAIGFSYEWRSTVFVMVGPFTIIYVRA